MKRHKSVIDLQTYTVTFGHVTIPIEKIHTHVSDGEVNVYRLSVQKRSVIPPQSVKYVTLKPDRPIQNSICVETNKDLQGLMPPNSVIDRDQTTIPFRTPTDRYITLKQGQCIGTGMEINDIFDLEGDETFSISKVTIENDKSMPSVENMKSQLPSHLQDLLKKSSVNLSEKEQFEVFCLLERFQHVFAKDDFDLALFNGNIKHKIDTLTARPVKQKLRRTPMGFEDELS